MPFTGKIGSDWDGEYSRWNFDETKNYLMVAKMMLEPGTSASIPLLDAELNENSEILLQMIRRSIKRIYGNGTTNNGFKIIQSGSDPNNNFTIMGGDGTPAGAGSIFVEGWQAMNLTNMEYNAQSYGPTALTTPTGAARTDEVYLDVYYTEIDRTDDSDIIDTTVGLETSRRIALVWEVHVVEGGTTPVDYTDTNNIQHWTLKLATITREADNAAITSSMIVDNRSAERTVALLTDLDDVALDAVELTSADNCNSLGDGTYYWSTSTPANAPGGSMIMIQKDDGNYPIQIAWGATGNGKIFVRRADGGTFYSWTEFVSLITGDARYGRRANNLSDMTASTCRENIGLGDTANVLFNMLTLSTGIRINGDDITGTTASRSSTSTTLALTAAGMNDHRTSGDHDGRYYTKDQVDSLLSNNTGVGQVGTYAFMIPYTTSSSYNCNPGDTLAGSFLRYYGTAGTYTGYASTSTPAGTWRCMGYTQVITAGDSESMIGTLWLRIS